MLRQIINPTPAGSNAEITGKVADWEMPISKYNASMHPKYEMDPEIVACSYEALLPAQMRSKMQALDTEMEDVEAMKKYVTKQLNSSQPIDANSGGAKTCAKTYMLDGAGGTANAGRC